MLIEGGWFFLVFFGDLFFQVEEDVVVIFLKYFGEVFFEFFVYESVDNRIYIVVSEGNGFCDMGGINQSLVYDIFI